MALIKCPECGHEISDKAIRCPHCGYVLKQQIPNNTPKENNNIKVSKDLVKKLGIAGGVLLVGMIIGTGIGHTNASKNVASESNNDVKQESIEVTPVIESEEPEQVADTEKPVFHNVPTDVTYKIGDKMNFSNFVIDNNITVTDNVDSDLEIEINSDDIWVDTAGDYKLILSATDTAGNTDEETVNIHIEDYPAHAAYLRARTLSKDNMTDEGSGSYKVDGIHVAESELESLEAGTMYRSLAQQFEGIEFMGKSLYKYINPEISKTVFAIEKPDTYEELKPYVDEVFEYVTPLFPVAEILNKIQGCSTVSGDFDYINAKFSFEIPDVTATAQEMHITEKMLGYILAALEEYAPEVTFIGNSYTCNLQVVGNAARANKNIITDEDFILKAGGDYESLKETNELEEIDKNGWDCVYFYDGANLGNPEDDNVEITSRGIGVNSSYNAVLYQYGVGIENNFNIETDPIKEMLEDYPNEYIDANTYFDDVTKYVTYVTEDQTKEIVFFFDQNKKVKYFVYDVYPVYVS